MPARSEKLCYLRGAMLCLEVPTDETWAQRAVLDLDAVLADHAHCEMKAAANALSLASRPPSSFAVARALADLAREELDHFQRVLDLLERRGIPLGAPPVDPYAAELRKASSALGGVAELGGMVERLLIGALIEARSCERFKLLLEVLDPVAHGDVLTLYRDLFPAEARHYRLFVEWAIEESGGREDAVKARLARLAAEEGRLIRRLAEADERCTIHG